MWPFLSIYNKYLSDFDFAKNTIFLKVGSDFEKKNIMKKGFKKNKNPEVANSHSPVPMIFVHELPQHSEGIP